MGGIVGKRVAWLMCRKQLFCSDGGELTFALNLQNLAFHKGQNEIGPLAL